MNITFEPVDDTPFDLEVKEGPTVLGGIIERTDGFFMFEADEIYYEQEQLEAIYNKLKELNAQARAS